MHRSSSPTRPDRLQQSLPFEEAEAAASERRNLLGLALQRLECDLHLAQFVLWVFNATQAGTAGELLKSYNELRRAPWGLCCSAAKARTTVARALQAGVVAARSNPYSSGGQRANGYRIDWEGVRQVLRLPVHASAETPHPPEPGAFIEQGYASTAQGHALTAQGDASTAQPYIGITSSLLPLCTTGPDRKAPPDRAGPDVSGGFQERGDDQEPPADSRPGKSCTPATIPDRLVADVPQLRDSAAIPVTSLPPRTLLADVFGPLRPEVFDSPALAVEWFRRQLSAYRPAMPGTKAGLLLWLATIEQIAADRQSRNRVALLVHRVATASWDRAVRFIPQAEAKLDALARSYPDVLSSATWPPAPTAAADPSLACCFEPEAEGSGEAPSFAQMMRQLKRRPSAEAQEGTDP